MNKDLQSNYKWTMDIKIHSPSNEIIEVSSPTHKMKCNFSEDHEKVFLKFLN